MILALITELAEYEELAHEVTGTEGELEETLFGARTFAEVVMADYEGESVGFALYFHNFSTFLGKPGLYLEDLYVNSEMRGKGIGKVLILYLASLAKKRGCGRFEWWVLDWNKPAIQFYQSIGARPMDEWTVQRVDGEALDQLANEFEVS